MNPCFDYSLYESDIALIDSVTNKTITYKNLNQNVQSFGSQFANEKFLVFIFMQPQLEFTLAYLSLINCDCAIALLDGNLEPSLKLRLIETYNPHYIIDMINYKDYTLITTEFTSLSVNKINNHINAPAIHSDLKLLLSTSGTTGSPKMVRLSAYNFLTNAASVSIYLNLNEKERAITSLPLHYSYGLSILHSHLLIGASVVLTPHSIVQKDFWEAINSHQCSSFAGVPYMYQMMDKLRINPADYTSIKTLTQAGGRLEPELTIKFFESIKSKNGRFYSMYGQTEATARIAYLPPGYLPEKAGSIGIAIPGGKLEIVSGELVYHGPNVMLGYAEKKEDLSLGDVLHGVLYTGDLGYQDEDGIFAITGRLKRISKVYGHRISLDELENSLTSFGRIAVTSDDRTISIFYVDPIKEKDCIEFLSKKFHLDPTTFQMVKIDSFPLTSSGKIDYPKLKPGM